MPTNQHQKAAEEEFLWQKNRVLAHLQGQPGRRATNHQLTKAVGFTPPLEKLIEMGVIQTVAPYDHIQLI